MQGGKWSGEERTVELSTNGNTPMSPIYIGRSPVVEKGDGLVPTRGVIVNAPSTRGNMRGHHRGAKRSEQLQPTLVCSGSCCSSFVSVRVDFVQDECYDRWSFTLSVSMGYIPIP